MISCVVVETYDYGNMNLLYTLQKLGLEGKAAKVYLSLLESGPATGYKIAKQTDIKRPTVYGLLTDLEKRKLVSRLPTGNLQVFVAESPEYLLSEKQKQVELLKRVLPELSSMQADDPSKPQARLYKGVDGIQEVYRRIFSTPEVWFFGTVADTLKVYPDAAKDFYHAVKAKQIKVRDLIVYGKLEQSYITKFKNLPGYELRTLPNQVGVRGDFALFGNMAACHSFRGEIFSLVITSEDIVHLLRCMYELAWEAAGSYNRKG